jgi:hypothetical protein
MAPDSLNLEVLEAAYARGRRRRVLAELAPVFAYVVVLGLVAGLRPQVLVAMAFTLVLSAVGLWRGQSLGRAVYPGLLVGIVPFACSFAGGHIGHVCTGDTCVSLCMPLCALGGAVAGLLVARAVRREPSPVLATGMGVLALGIGSFGCPHAGLTSLMAMGLGIGLPLLMARMLRRAA